MADSPTGYKEKRLKITYLKSYTGMGTVRVRLCGEFLYEFNYIDALFHDQITYHISVPEVFMLNISGGDGERCAAMAPNKRTLDIVYTGLGDGNHQELLEIRKKNHAKFKLMSVQICTDSPNV